MKGNQKIIERLNARLSDELTAINQYMVHAEMCENWRYNKLHDVVLKRSITEMKHAEKIIARILFLEGMPIVNKINKITIGSDVEKQLKNDWTAEYDAIKFYNEDIHTAGEIGDTGTRELLESILTDEESHIDWIEAQLDQIKQMGIQHYLSEQIS